MKISAGISEISLPRVQNNRIQSDKIYIWPQYGEGQVQKIRGVIRRTDSNAVYSKPVNEDRDKVLRQYNSFHREYNSSGTILKKHVNSEPGMLFDALV
jgi:hypothetical protein